MAPSSAQRFFQQLTTDHTPASWLNIRARRVRKSRFLVLFLSAEAAMTECQCVFSQGKAITLPKLFVHLLQFQFHLFYPPFSLKLLARWRPSCKSSRSRGRRVPARNNWIYRLKLSHPSGSQLFQSLCFLGGPPNTHRSKDNEQHKTRLPGKHHLTMAVLLGGVF